MAKNLRLKAARAEHDMTQGDLAEAVGATRQDVYKRQDDYLADTQSSVKRFGAGTW